MGNPANMAGRVEAEGEGKGERDTNGMLTAPSYNNRVILNHDAGRDVLVTNMSVPLAVLEVTQLSTLAT